jgi:hypothetical protein
MGELYCFEVRSNEVVLTLGDRVQDLISHRVRVHISSRPRRPRRYASWFTTDFRTLQTCSLLQATRKLDSVGELRVG